MATLTQIAAGYDLYPAVDDKKTNHLYPIPRYFEECDTYEAGYFFKNGTPFLLVKKEDSDLLTWLVVSGQDCYLLPLSKDTAIFTQMSEGKIRKVIADNLTEPRKMKIASITLKKLNEWEKYCKAYLLILNNELKQHQAENTAIIEQINTFIHSVPKPCEVIKANEQNRIIVKTKFFTILLTHDKGNARLTQQITFNGTLNDIIKIES
jgi:hypothetical protein